MDQCDFPCFHDDNWNKSNEYASSNRTGRRNHRGNNVTDLAGESIPNCKRPGGTDGSRDGRSSNGTSASNSDGGDHGFALACGLWSSFD